MPLIVLLQIMHTKVTIIMHSLFLQLMLVIKNQNFQDPQTPQNPQTLKPSNLQKPQKPQKI